MKTSAIANVVPLVSTRFNTVNRGIVFDWISKHPKVSFHSPCILQKDGYQTYHLLDLLYKS